MPNADALKRAIDLYRSGMFDRAGAPCQALVDARPDDLEVLHLLAMVRSPLGRWRDALEGSVLWPLHSNPAEHGASAGATASGLVATPRQKSKLPVHFIGRPDDPQSLRSTYGAYGH